VQPRRSRRLDAEALRGPPGPLRALPRQRPQVRLLQSQQEAGPAFHGPPGETGRRQTRSRPPALRLVQGAQLPDGREGAGWSASYRKSYLSALRFLYRHFQADDELPDIDPTVLESSPRVIVKRGYTPSKEEIKRLLETDGPARAVLLVHWLFYAPSRRKTYADARWCDIDLDAAEWEVVGKNGKVDIFPLAPPLLRAFRVYRRWQLSEAERHPAMRDALSDPETAYVLITSNGKKTSPSTVTKIATWHGIRAGVGLKKATPGIDAVNGMTSRVTPTASAEPGPPSPSTTRRTLRRLTWCQRFYAIKRSRLPGATTRLRSPTERGRR
jgi:integrase